MRRVGLAAAMLCVSLAAPAHAAAQQHGFVATRDGTQLRYSLDLPDGKGPFPTVMNYTGYTAGATSGDNGVELLRPELLKRGYAVMGLSARGTGCSEGTFDLFGPQLGLDGHDAVEWAARQPWSNGHVGMAGKSFGGITALATAATRPPHLDAITPSSATSDLYRDVLYPGGILQYAFPFFFTGYQKGAYATAAHNDPEPRCAANYAAHEPSNLSEYFIPKLALEHPYDDSFFTTRRPSSSYGKIDVPVLMFNQWQDEQLPGRIFEVLDTFRHPKRVWANFSNGNHMRDALSTSAQALELDFLDHYVRGVSNRFPSAVPHLMLDMETAIAKGKLINEPAWRIGQKSVRGFAPTVWPLPLGPDGTLGAAAPRGASSDSFAYPRAAADVLDPLSLSPSFGPAGVVAVSTGQAVWKLPFDKDGALAYTSGTLSRDAVVAGPASLDLWLASTATDTDIQATITEVRPDGQELYIQRGWLRASARALDAEQSTALRPYHPYTKEAEQPLTAGTPALLRVPVFPFAHAFRKGSRIRVIVDAPTSHTGFWAFVFNTTRATNTVLHDAEHPTRLVLGLLPGESAQAPLPACDSLRNQPCRANAWTTMPSAPLAVPSEGEGQAPRTNRTCTSRRTFIIRLPRAMRRATVTYGGRTVKARRSGGRLRATIDLRHLAPGRVTVRVKGRDRRGRAVRQTRVYGLCTGRSGV